jgi:regulator of cell morphogenesis and NO signaling
MLIQKESKIGNIVAENFRTAKIFEDYGIDFCCGGKISISEACGEKGINPDELTAKLTGLNENQNITNDNYNAWEPDFLIDYIIKTHHSYVNRALPVIVGHAEKVALKHGANHAEVIKISELFSGIQAELEIHMQKEELMLFPYIKYLLEAERNSDAVSIPPFGTIENPIKVMEKEHDSAGRVMDEINSLSNSYSIPEDTCTTYSVLYQELKDFENDLHKHIHLENNILFPKAIELENKLTFQKAI